ncbi:MAG: glycosyltransferase family 4 protein [Myxococcota bacterium]
MRVGVVVPELVTSHGGGSTLIGEILAALPRRVGSHEFELLHFGAGEAPQGTALDTVLLTAEPFPSPEALERVVLERELQLVWFTSPQSEPVAVPFFATVWDLEHRRHPFCPEVSTSGWRWEEREFHYRNSLPRAAYVLTGSEAGRLQVHDFYRVPLERIAVIPFPTPSFPAAEAAVASLDVDRDVPFVYYPAQFWPHKNHVAVALALEILVREGLRVDAVFTGADKGNQAHVRRVVVERDLEHRVRFAGLVERSTVAAYYRAAAALVFPSFFGPDNLPPLEAFGLGCPVIAADVAGAREVLGDAALFFDPRDERELASAIRRVLNDAELRAGLVERGRVRASAQTAAGYVAAVVALLDAFEAYRRCWSPAGRFEHL